ncbi:hypothetical protein IAU59_007551 [Kwoniella sp. CBS 9459]
MTIFRAFMPKAPQASMIPPSKQGLPLRPRAAAFPPDPSSWATSSSPTSTHPTRLSGAKGPQTAGSSSILPNQTPEMKDFSSSDLFDMDSSRSSSTAPAAALALADRASMSKGAPQEPTGSDTASQVLLHPQCKMPQVAKSTRLSTSSLTASSDASFESVEGLMGTSVTAAVDPPLALELTDIPGKGFGLVATRYIKRGELILRESPFFLVPLAHSLRLTKSICGVESLALLELLSRGSRGTKPDLILKGQTDSTTHESSLDVCRANRATVLVHSLLDVALDDQNPGSVQCHVKQVHFDVVSLTYYTARENRLLLHLGVPGK